MTAIGVHTIAPPYSGIPLRLPSLTQKVHVVLVGCSSYTLDMDLYTS